MSDRYTETTRKGWGTRLKESLGGVIAGLLALVAMPVMLFWNEGRAVQTTKSLNEGAGLVREVPSDRVDPVNANQLIHLTGDLLIEKKLEDPLTGVSVLALRLERDAQMYQWIESCDSSSDRELGGGETTVTTCTYSRKWESDRVDSGAFRQPQGHFNPEAVVASGTQQQSSARLGAFTAGSPVLSRVSGNDPVTISDAMLASARTKLPGGATAQAQGNIIYLKDPAAPSVGDMRLVFTSVPAGPVSVIAQQRKVQDATELATYQTKAGDALLLVDRGTVAPAAMFASAHQANTIITWLLRVIGLVFLFAGLAFMLSPLAVLADVVPFVGTIVRYGTGTVAAILAALIGGLTIGIAWIWYRPLIGIAIIALAAIIALFFWRRGAKRAAKLPKTAAQVA